MASNPHRKETAPCLSNAVRVLVVACSVALAGCGTDSPAEKRDGGQGSSAAGKPAAKIERTIGNRDYYHLVQADGIWWFAKPGGGRFVSLGINHIEPILISSENNRGVYEKKYGSGLFLPNGRPDLKGEPVKRWVSDSVDLAASWGFNSLGVHNPVRQSRLPYVSKFRPIRVDGWHNVERQYADPFSDQTREMVYSKAARWCGEYRDDKLMLGVSFSDMPRWKHPKDEMHEWVEFVASLPADSPGKVKWVDLLRQTYTSVEAAEEVYGIGAKSWDDFLARRDWKNPTDQARAVGDSIEFLPRIADAWFGLMTGAIRECDPNHLIFGDKLEGKRNWPRWMDPIIARHFDLAYIQWYDTADRQIPRLRRFYARTGKPVLMGDSSFSCPNENVPQPKGIHLPTQRDVGRAYKEYLRTLLGEPYALGWHYCGFIEGSPDLEKHHFYLSIQPGLLEPDGTPHREAIVQVIEGNKNAHAWHESADAKISLLVDSKKGEGLSQRPEDRGKTGDLPSGSAHGVRHFVKDGVDITSLDDAIFNARRFGVLQSKAPRKNIGWVITEEGVVVIDTGSSQTAALTKQIIRSITDLPIKYIIYTHHHSTQVSGTDELADPETKVIAHEYLVNEFDNQRDLSAHYRRVSSIQFNLKSGRAETEREYRYPDITYSSTYAFTLGGIEFELFHVVGETEDYTVVHVPRYGAVWTADLVGMGVPMLASPMKPVRDPVKWRQALEKIAALKPRIVFTSIGKPLDTPELIQERFDAQIDYLDFIHQAVVREMNAGSSVSEALENISLPAELSSNRFLKERYGCTHFNVRGLYHRYGGWFDQNGTHLRLSDAKETARTMVELMGGREKIEQQAAELRANGKPYIALELLDVVIDSGSRTGKARQLKSEILRDLARNEQHIMTRKMYKKLSELSESDNKAAP